MTSADEFEQAMQDFHDRYGAKHIAECQDRLAYKNYLVQDPAERKQCMRDFFLKIKHRYAGRNDYAVTMEAFDGICMNPACEQIVLGVMWYWEFDRNCPQCRQNTLASQNVLALFRERLIKLL